MKIMNYRILPVIWLGVAWRAAGADGGGAGPSRVEHPVAEGELNRLVLTREAVERLGIATAKVERRKVGAVRLYGGLVLLPLGAPGVLQPRPGATPEELRRLAELQVTADGAVEAAAAGLEAATVALRRAEELSRESAGSGRARDEAKALRDQAVIALRTAEGQRRLLGEDPGEVLGKPERWISVAVPSLELAGLDAGARAVVRVTAGAGGAAVEAEPVASVPSASAAAGTVDLHYRCAGLGMVPGQRVMVEIAVAGSGEEVLTVPWSAVLYDAGGGSWVYEAAGGGAYRRRRVDVQRKAGVLAVLGAGPAAGVEVVTSGAAELFGAEFGGFK